MKKFYSQLLLLALLIAGAAECLAQSTSGKVYLGYAKYDDQIWEYDGLSLQFDAKVGCAIRLTREMLAPYVGGTITGMRVGWDTSTQTGVYEGFVRNDFNSENLATGKKTVRYSSSDANPGWNDLTLTNYVIPDDVDQLIVGFTTQLKKNVCAIPLLYPKGVDNSCFIWVEGDNDEQGNPRWVPMHSMKDQYDTYYGKLPILLVVKDTQGTFNYVPVINLLTDNGIQQTGTADDVLMRIKNIGSQKINTIEVTSRQGEQTWSKTITASVATGATSKIFLAPIYCFQTGDVELSITKVNGKELAKPEVRTLNIIGVPKDVASQHKRRPLVEYFESENNYRSARYYDEYVEDPVLKKSSAITFVCQHLDDQFMTGEDDATALALRLCSGDSAQVGIPAMCVDRAMATDNVLFQMATTYSPMFDVLTQSADAQGVFTAAAKRPTFVSLTTSGLLADDGESLSVTVNGEVASGIMPEGEQPRLTVYLMERDVESDSQVFWTEKEKEEYQGNYTHANVIREILSAPEGDPITAGGSLTKEYSTLLDPTWDVENMYLVAFIHRDGKMGGRHMHVFNSAKGNIELPDGIEMVENPERHVESPIYDLSGRRISKTTKGVYIKGNKKVVIRNS